MRDLANSRLFCEIPIGFFVQRMLARKDRIWVASGIIDYFGSIEVFCIWDPSIYRQRLARGGVGCRGSMAPLLFFPLLGGIFSLTHHLQAHFLLENGLTESSSMSVFSIFSIDDQAAEHHLDVSDEVL